MLNAPTAPIGEKMKKLLLLTILFIMACFALTGCGSSAVVPEVKVRWSGSSSETLVYDVRLASDYELTYSNYYVKGGKRRIYVNRTTPCRQSVLA